MFTLAAAFLAPFLLTPAPDDQPGAFLQPGVEVLRAYEGVSPGAQLGGITRSLGDLNRDHAPDFAINAPFADVGGLTRVGRVRVLDGRTGDLLREHVGTFDNAELTGPWVGPDLTGDGIPEYGLCTGATSPIAQGWIYNGDPDIPAEHALLLTLRTPDQRDIFIFGEDMGDIDHDGVHDVAWSAQAGLNPDGVDTGFVHILSGKAIAETGAMQILRSHYGNRSGDLFGNVCGLLDDVDADGVDDYFITLPQSNPPNTTGRARVYSGATGQRLCQLAGTSGRSAVLGLFYTYPMSDITGDGVRELYVADTGDYTHGRETGRAYALDPVDCAVVWQRSGPRAYEGFGVGHNLAQDANGDGIEDLVIGSYHSADGGEPLTGKAQIIDAVTGKQIRRVTSTTSAEWFGSDAHGVGDMNNDAIPDFLVSAWNAPGLDGVTPNTGRVYIIAGQWHKPGCGPVDLNADNLLDNGDIGVFIDRYLNDPTTVDLNHDAVTDTADLALFARLFLAGC